MPPAAAPRDWEDVGSSYPALRRGIARQLAAPGPRRAREAPPISERLFQAIWYDGHFHSAGLQLADGRPIEIKSPGRWNSEAGPDFLKAELVIAGTAVKGDVELHLRASDWRGHQHGDDLNYRGVVLHVILDNDDGREADTTPAGRPIPRLELRPHLHGDLDSLAEIVTGEDFPFQSPAMVGRCQPVLSRLGHDPQVTSFFDAAAVRRVRSKTDRLADQLGGADAEQVFFQALMTAMGHRASKTLFFLLAKRVPVGELCTLVRPWQGAKRVLAAEAVLMHVANLIRPAPQTAPLWDEETMSHLDAVNRVWAELGGHFSDRVIPATAKWHTGVRPVNFPSRRIAGIARLISQGDGAERGLFADLIAACAGFAEEASEAKRIRAHIDTLVDRLAVHAENDYWARRHTLGGKRLAKPLGLIGESRARSVVFNALLPLVLLTAKRSRDRSLTQWTQEALLQFPALEENTVTRFMKYRVIGTPTPPRSLFKTEMRQQALFHIFTDCCDHVTTSCDQCAFFARLGGGR